MADVYGFDAEGIRKIEEVVRRVLSTSYGKGGRRQRWPVPNSGGGSRVIRFRFNEFVSGSTLTALCTVLAPTGLAGDEVQVTDATEDECFFGDETEGELLDRNGYAVMIDGAYEVFSLCCPAGS